VEVNKTLMTLRDKAIKDEDMARNLTTVCKTSKTNITTQLLENLHLIGRSLLNINHILSPVGNVQKGLIDFQIVIDKCSKLLKLPEAYTECLHEIRSRSEYKKKVTANVQRLSAQFEVLRDRELTKRVAFRQNYGNALIPEIMPYLHLTEEQERTLPTPKIVVSPFDENIPAIGDLPVDLEDDFSMVFSEEGNPKDRMKELVEENASLHENLNSLLKKMSRFRKPPKFFKSTNRFYF